jgi:hypothetical protein
MALKNVETLSRLWQRFAREQLAALPPDQREVYEHQFARRFEELLEAAANGAPDDGFLDLIGFGGRGTPPFGEISYPYVKPDFDEAVMPTQLHAAAELYYIYQHERMRIFEVADVLRRLFELGRIRVQQGPGARGLYLFEKHEPLRYKRRDRMIAYRRTFNYGTAPTPAGAIVNRSFHRLLVGFMVALAQYYRDLLIGEVIRGGQLLNQRPFGSIATVQRIGLDLRWALDRSSYGNILALTTEVGHYLKKILEVFDTPDIKKAFDANTKWDVIEIVSNRYLGGMAELSQRAKMAESGREILRWIADSDFSTSVDPILFQSLARRVGTHAEAWVAAYRMTREGRNFRGITSSFMRLLGHRLSVA